MFLAITIFILSAIGIYLSGELVVKNTVRFAQAIGVSVFIISFFLMGVASAFPNLFVGIQAALDKIPELSLGDVFGNTFINLTLLLSLAVLFSPEKKIKFHRLFIRQSIVFMLLTSVAALFLIADGVLSRYDGLFLLFLFLFYVWWSKSNSSHSEILKEVYKDEEALKEASHKATALFSFLKIILGLIILFLASNGIIFSAKYFSEYFNLSLIFIGILITGFGNALPEIYFTISSARKGETQMVFGNIVGSIIAPGTLVLGIVALIQPIYVSNVSFLEINRLIYLIVILFILWLVERQKEEINLKNTIFLILIYLSFLGILFWFK
jgi:cation:H+ antiporter